MKNNIISSIILSTALLSMGLSSCSKDEPTLNAPTPTANFTYNILTPTSYAAPQNLELINTSASSTGAYWYIPDIGATGDNYIFSVDTAKVTIMFAGDYEVKMLAGGPGGLSDTIRQTIKIEKDNPYAVDPDGIMGVLTGAGLGLEQRTWIPYRVVNSVIVYDTYDNALNVIDGKGGPWWAFGPGEIAQGTGREGYLDDKYTFTFGKIGQFIYNDNNTIYLDQGGSGWTAALPAPWNSFGGTTSSTDLFNLVPALKPWTSGTFGYSISPAPAGAMKLGTITVNGTGAHMGLPDKTNSGDMTTSITVNSIKYDVLRIVMDAVDDSGTHFDMIVIGVQEPGLVWTYMFRSNR